MRGVPLPRLQGRSLRAACCPHCSGRAVFILDDYVPLFANLRGLLSLHQERLLNPCGECGKVVRRDAIRTANGVDLPGDLVAACAPPVSG